VSFRLLRALREAIIFIEFVHFDKKTPLGSRKNLEKYLIFRKISVTL
jgi:hypothetical protein